MYGLIYLIVNIIGQLYTNGMVWKLKNVFIAIQVIILIYIFTANYLNPVKCNIVPQSPTAQTSSGEIAYTSFRFIFSI